MRLTPLVLLSLAALAPAAAALPWVHAYEGEGTVALTWFGRTRCADDATVRAHLVHREGEGVLDVVAASDGCGTWALALRAVGDGNGWELTSADGRIARGTLEPHEIGWRLHATVSDCPPTVICEFPRELHVHALFPGDTIVL